jgi:hypothetical protein
VREAGDHVTHNTERLHGSFEGLSVKQIGRMMIAEHVPSRVEFW